MDANPHAERVCAHSLRNPRRSRHLRARCGAAHWHALAARAATLSLHSAALPPAAYALLVREFAMMTIAYAADVHGPRFPALPGGADAQRVHAGSKGRDHQTSSVNDHSHLKGSKTRRCASVNALRAEGGSEGLDNTSVKLQPYEIRSERRLSGGTNPCRFWASCLLPCKAESEHAAASASGERNLANILQPAASTSLPQRRSLKAPSPPQALCLNPQAFCLKRQALRLKFQVKSSASSPPPPQVLRLKLQALRIASPRLTPPSQRSCFFTTSRSPPEHYYTLYAVVAETRCLRTSPGSHAAPDSLAARGVRPLSLGRARALLARAASRAAPDSLATRVWVRRRKFAAGVGSRCGEWLQMRKDAAQISIGEDAAWCTWAVCAAALFQYYVL
ncbi:hypothetical protein GGX14DRAFT_392227 [Mycena pura]|uniref:Uncharacterized protein n=1 Tax=Mycena pura TaxID=153505 RepID=A0AAD6YHZ3_9AGAR|nr:hypothetical protein GGX14DRAFT_392227 [Mycena pura]